MHYCVAYYIAYSKSYPSLQKPTPTPDFGKGPTSLGVVSEKQHSPTVNVRVDEIKVDSVDGQQMITTQLVGWLYSIAYSLHILACITPLHQMHIFLYRCMHILEVPFRGRYKQQFRLRRQPSRSRRLHSTNCSTSSRSIWRRIKREWICFSRKFPHQVMTRFPQVTPHHSGWFIHSWFTFDNS